jgi:hypothetical protein
LCAASNQGGNRPVCFEDEIEEVDFSRLDLRRHILRSKPDYDPVAEQVLLNILSLD